MDNLIDLNFEDRVKGLSPGLYLMQGNQTKSLDIGGGSWSFLKGDSAKSDTLASLVEQVGWVFAALDHREQQIVQTPMKWEINGNEVPEEEAPFGLDSYELARIDRAIQIYSRAYYHVGNGSFSRQNDPVSLAWLNPYTITPNRSKVPSLHEGFQSYWRTTQDWTKLGEFNEFLIGVNDLVRIEKMGLAELANKSSAGTATLLAASVLQTMAQLSASTFDRSGLPIIMVRVKGLIPGQSHSINPDQERRGIVSDFRRIFNRNNPNETKVVSVPDGVEVERLSLTPSEMLLSETEKEKAVAVLAGHGVPVSLVFSDAANEATMEFYTRRFALNVGYRLKWIATKLNQSEPIKAINARLVVEPHKLAVNLTDELLRAQMVQSYISSGMTLDNAIKVAGVKLPEDYDQSAQDRLTQQNQFNGVNAPNVQQNENSAVSGPSQATQNNEAERKAYRKYLNRPRKRSFETDELTAEEMAFIRAEVYGPDKVDAQTFEQVFP